MARSSYSSNKRQKELARKRKQEEKKQRKLERDKLKAEENSDMPENDEKTEGAVSEG